MYCVTELYLRHISIVSCRQKEFCLVVALSVRLLGLVPWSDTYPDRIAQPWIRCSNIEIGNGIESDMLTRSRCRKRDSPTSLKLCTPGGTSFIMTWLTWSPSTWVSMLHTMQCPWGKARDFVSSCCVVVSQPHDSTNKERQGSRLNSLILLSIQNHKKKIL